MCLGRRVRRPRSDRGRRLCGLGRSAARVAGRLASRPGRGRRGSRGWGSPGGVTPPSRRTLEPGKWPASGRRCSQCASCTWCVLSQSSPHSPGRPTVSAGGPQAHATDRFRLMEGRMPKVVRPKPPIRQVSSLLVEKSQAAAHCARRRRTRRPGRRASNRDGRSANMACEHAASGNGSWRLSSASCPTSGTRTSS